MFGKTGAANPRYVDGSSPERQRAYASASGKAFIRVVLDRDGYACRRCGSGKRGARGLHAHHIAPWAGNEALRFDPDNAVTLCRACHEWVHSKANASREWLA
jgi:thymidylate synthase (FAD)